MSGRSDEPLADVLQRPRIGGVSNRLSRRFVLVQKTPGVFVSFLSSRCKVLNVLHTRTALILNVSDLAKRTTGAVCGGTHRVTLYIPPGDCLIVHDS